MDYSILFQIISDYVEKCKREHPKESSGLLENDVDYSIDDGNLTNAKLQKIIGEMCEKHGLEISVNSSGMSQVYVLDDKEYGKFFMVNLWDDKTKTLLDLGSLAEHQGWVDFYNNGFPNYYCIKKVYR